MFVGQVLIFAVECAEQSEQTTEEVGTSLRGLQLSGRIGGACTAEGVQFFEEAMRRMGA
jgi:hypothetical protein